MMRVCERCGHPVGPMAPRCPQCRCCSEAVLLRLLRTPEAGVREDAASDLGSLVPTEAIVRGLAMALSDPVVRVRRAAGVSLFICGDKAGPAVLALTQALGDSDTMVRRLAAASLSMVGSPAAAALPTLASMRGVPDELLRVWVCEAERRIGMNGPHA
jgi:hypothetical protein